MAVAVIGGVLVVGVLVGRTPVFGVDIQAHSRAAVSGASLGYCARMVGSFLPYLQTHTIPFILVTFFWA